jgi:6,7-dimethyl-8-ribityllumazine synthase
MNTEPNSVASFEKQNLSAHSLHTFAGIEKMRFVILVSEWNAEVTRALEKGAIATLLAAGASADNIVSYPVPGSYELPLAAQWFAQKPEVDAVICLGCVIQGETRHFDFISQAVADGIMKVSLENNKPVVFGVLTPNTPQQALDRAGGKHGNKGDEAAHAAIKMLALQQLV